MHQLTKPSWWISMITSTLLTMFFIYIIKQATQKFDIPVVSDVVGAV